MSVIERFQPKKNRPQHQYCNHQYQDCILCKYCNFTDLEDFFKCNFIPGCCGCPKSIIIEDCDDDNKYDSNTIGKYKKICQNLKFELHFVTAAKFAEWFGEKNKFFIFSLNQISVLGICLDQDMFSLKFFELHERKFGKIQIHYAVDPQIQKCKCQQKLYYCWCKPERFVEFCTKTNIKIDVLYDAKKKKTKFFQYLLLNYSINLFFTKFEPGIPKSQRKPWHTNYVPALFIRKKFSNSVISNENHVCMYKDEFGWYLQA